MKLTTVIMLFSTYFIFKFFSASYAMDVVNIVSCTENNSESVQTPELRFLNIAENLIQQAKVYASRKVSCLDRGSLIDMPIDCADILEKDKRAKTRVYKIWPRSRVSKGVLTVYCDMDDDGGGWTVLQRRGNFNSSKEYFFEDWISYKIGFGDPSKDFWIGNDNIFALTNQRDNLVKFVLTDWEGNMTYATYDDFWIDDEDHNFTMHVKRYRGTAGDSFLGTDNMPFSTKDRDNDKHEKSCAEMFKGAWWYTSCHSSNLNGYYLKGVHVSHADGVEWKTFRGHKYSLKDTFIKIRPKNFQKSVNIDVTPQ